jgi:hypothetical protein
MVKVLQTGLHQKYSKQQIWNWHICQVHTLHNPSRKSTPQIVTSLLQEFTSLGCVCGEQRMNSWQRWKFQQQGMLGSNCDTTAVDGVKGNTGDAFGVQSTNKKRKLVMVTLSITRRIEIVLSRRSSSCKDTKFFKFRGKKWNSSCYMKAIVSNLGFLCTDNVTPAQDKS